jgi:hypothetical protein
MVHQDASHELARQGKEVSAILPMHMSLINQSHVGFVDQSRSLQSVTTILPPHVMVSKPVQFFVNEITQPIECRLVSMTPVQ